MNFNTFEYFNILSWIPSHKEYSHFSKRVESFKLWPQFLLPNVKQLCAAGFVYTGSSDICYCFHCGIILNDWTDIDNPSNEHRKVAPNCVYLNMVS